MPVKSKAQMRLMYAVAGGTAKVPGLSKAEAKKMIAHTPRKTRQALGKKKK
jgi:phosphoribosylcarboxyaminoimidazole (NCAIR) mutase